MNQNNHLFKCFFALTLVLVNVSAELFMGSAFVKFVDDKSFLCCLIVNWLRSTILEFACGTFGQEIFNVGTNNRKVDVRYNGFCYRCIIDNFNLRCQKWDYWLKDLFLMDCTAPIHRKKLVDQRLMLSMIKYVENMKRVSIS